MQYHPRPHEMLKFPVNGGVVTIRSTILMPNECATITTTSKDSIKKIEEGQENLKVAIHPDFPDQEVALGGTLSIEGKTALCGLLKRNLYIFAWQPSDMTGVPRQIAEHKLTIRDEYLPVSQKKGARLRNEPRPSRQSWRMCVDFTNLNKACPQDCYPLLKIDWKVESLCGYPFKCLLDVYKGYHQIQMAELDEEKMAFHTPHGVYCYTKMSFGFKNAGATYQRLVDKSFKKLVGWNLEVYVNDLVIKSHTEAELLKDIEETFRTLRKINMKLNPKKCTFGAVEGMFLGYMVGPEGIKPCPEKIEAMLQLPSPRTIKEVHSKGRGNHQWWSSKEVCMGQYSVSLWASGRDSFGQRANRSLEEGIKARLGEGNKNWIEEIPQVLWAHRTMIKSSNGDTPFSLTYGTKAVIPAEIRMPTYRTAVVDVVHNDDEIRLNLDLLEESRERAAIRKAKAKSKMTRYYNARVRGVTFKPGDYVYRSNEESHTMDGGKLGPK
ncbi:reverse transcriptase domain-containing protein [Tanacetum coccineum]